jgi:hypothetical protein
MIHGPTGTTVEVCGLGLTSLSELQFEVDRGARIIQFTYGGPRHTHESPLFYLPAGSRRWPLRIGYAVRALAHGILQFPIGPFMAISRIADILSGGQDRTLRVLALLQERPERFLNLPNA